MSRSGKTGPQPDPHGHSHKSGWAFGFAGDRLFVLGSIPGRQRLVYRGANNQLHLFKP